jgi:hypothetical protein
MVPKQRANPQRYTGSPAIASSLFEDDDLIPVCLGGNNASPQSPSNIESFATVISEKP